MATGRAVHEAGVRKPFLVWIESRHFRIVSYTVSGDPIARRLGPLYRNYDPIPL